jgi:DNA-binding MarR family transcriptional regulator
LKLALKPVAVPEFVEQFSRRMLNASRTRRLNRLQWSALRFFGCTSKKARTIDGFAAAHSISRRHAVQIVAQLRRRRLLKLRKPQVATRPEIFDVAARGAKLLRRDPQRSIEAALARLSDRERRALTKVLKRACAALTVAGNGARCVLLFVTTGAWSYGANREQQSDHSLALYAFDTLSRLA